MKMICANRWLAICLVVVCNSLIWHSVEAEKVMRPKIKDIKLWSDNVHVTHSFVSDPTDPHINVSLNVLQELHEVDVHVEGHVTQKQDPTYFLSFNATYNICPLLNWRSQSPVGRLINVYLKEYGNLIETCPIAKGTYNLNKFWLPEDPATSTLPEVDFELQVQAFHVDANKKRTMMINDHVTGEAVVQDVENVKRGLLALLPKSG